MLDSQTRSDLGVTHHQGIARLRVFSTHATAMTLCLVDADGTVTRTIEMASMPGGIWQAECAELVNGQRYAVRADGPSSGTNAFDKHRLLVEPYARQVANVGTVAVPIWTAQVVETEPFDWGQVRAPLLPLRDVVVYEAHVKGFTQLAPHMPEELRGSYAGLAHEDTIAYLQSVGVTAVELLPVHAFASESFLRRQGMANYWGYNTLGFFAPHADYASPAARAAGPHAVAREFKGMVKHLHAAGIEVYLDVVYNHTSEGGRGDETSMFRGLDNATYYRHDMHGNPVDETGCGNSLDTSEAVVRELILDSLRYWVEEFRIDGFRFDLAATLGRNAHHAFERHHPLLEAIVNDDRLADTKLIAEPWDVGMGGWQTGNFPEDWSEWNDSFRDHARSFWVRDIAEARSYGVHPEGAGAFSTSFAGSSNMFSDDRGPLASVNFVTAHDGFTLRDLVSYNVKHNLQNAELGRDGTGDNRSWNFGVEGPSDSSSIETLRRRTMRNLLSTVLLSAGVPMLTAGDEVARSQKGNNNPYNQDSPLTWFSWDLSEIQLAQLAHTRRLIELRGAHQVLRPSSFNHGHALSEHGTRRRWFDALGNPMGDGSWQGPGGRTLQVLLDAYIPESDADFTGDAELVDGVRMLIDRLLIVVHGSEDDAALRTPAVDDITGYRLLWDSTHEHPDEALGASRVLVPGQLTGIEGPSVQVYAVDVERLHHHI